VQEGTRFALKQNYVKRYWNKPTLDMTAELAALAQAKGISLTGTALKWCLANQAVDSVICGVSNCGQLVQNLSAYEDTTLTAELKTQCDDIYKKYKGERINYFKS
jgi:aryl-alcohol dehydrogenase-like predicted oxidoreductase